MRSFDGQRTLKRAIQIVPFRLRHLPRVLRIERASFGADAWPRRYFLELYGECRDFFVIAKCGGRIAGYAVACAEKREAEIASLAVHPDYRRRGVGDALMRYTLRRLRAAGVRRVELMVRTGNAAGAQLYRSLGFRRVRLAPGYYEDGGDGVLMARAIQ
ncbi:MAG TPA: ribosomal protein S18-alanine N-acetyltransferase [Bryobacteraceae bacterium]|nr:ribosomal protein S18-alanine N-acetyltransferase [Bryobacteraceae bacterium]